MAPKDLFHLSCVSKDCEKVVGEHLFETCRLQLERPAKLSKEICLLDCDRGHCSLKFSRGRSFRTKDELIDFVLKNWDTDEAWFDYIRLNYKQPELTELKELKPSFSHDFFNGQRPCMSSVWWVDGGVLTSHSDFRTNFRIDSAGIRSDGHLPKFALRLKSDELEFIKYWSSYLMASKTVTADCWGWAIRNHYNVLFSCVFSKREGGNELELFVDIQSEIN